MIKYLEINADMYKTIFIYRKVSVKKSLLIWVISATVLLANAQNYYEMKKEAKALYKRGDKSQAIALTKKFIKAHPSSIRAKNLLAVFYYWSGEYDKAKEILTKLVSKHHFPEAEKLLQKIEAKSSSKPHTSTSTKVKKTSKQRDRKREAKRETLLKKEKLPLDLQYILEQIEKDPKDLISRVILANYYFKTKAYKRAYTLAKEALKLDPNNEEMLKIARAIKPIHPSKRQKSKRSSIREDISKKLARFEREKNYLSYLNLYRAIVDNRIKLSKHEHAMALYSAIEIGDMNEAKKIIDSGVLPDNRRTREIKKLLKKKVKGHQR